MILLFDLQVHIVTHLAAVALVIEPARQTLVERS
jgi:hypothetical protein